MGQLLIRNVDDQIISRLKQQAARDSMSLEQKMREMVEREANREDEAFWELARVTREMTRGAGIDVEAVIQDGREERERVILGSLRR